MACSNAVQSQIAEAGLEDRIHFAEVLGSEGISALLSQSDIFALPSRYEGYGMAFAEAMAHGLPVVATTAPAIPATVPPGAGILVAPDDPDAFAEALRRLMHDPTLRRRLGDGAWAHAQTLPRWEDTAAIIAGVIQGVGDGRLLG